MCGWVILRASDHNDADLRSLTKQIQHRGSLPPTFAERAGWLLGHVRLPIQGGVEQPIMDNNSTMVYNGEIFNYDTENYTSDTQWLFDELTKDSSMSSDNLQRMDGFYSFGIVDEAALCIGTDYLAQKPVYVRYDSAGLVTAIGSEMRAVLPSNELSNWQQNIDQFWLSTVCKFRYYPMQDGRTWHKDVKTMPPGRLWKILNTGEISDNSEFGSLKLRTDILALSPNISTDQEKAAVILRDTMIESTQRRIQLSDVPVSILLSGGLDSSIIYTIAKNILGLPEITTFTIENAEDQKFIELLNPSDVRYLSFNEIFIENVVQVNEGPVDLGSMAAQYHIGEAVRAEGFDVALSGDAADELFGGYRRAKEYDSQASDVWSEMVNYHLPRLDKMMMSHTVELRSPFLGRDVIELALSLPYQWRIDKNLLKQAFANVLPEEIIQRKKEPLKIDSVRQDKNKHSLDLMRVWLQLDSPI